MNEPVQPQRVSFTVFGEPKAWKRSGQRIVTKGDGTQFIHHFDASAKEKRTLAQSMQQYRFDRPLRGPVLLIARIYRTHPKASNKKTQMMLRSEILPTTKPDLDNYEKLVKDAAKSILWMDDNQVTDVIAIKRYSDIPRLELTVVEMNNGIFMDILTRWLQTYVGKPGEEGAIICKTPRNVVKMRGVLHATDESYKELQLLGDNNAVL